MRAAARCLIAAITICSWLAISNHCTISALASKAPTKQSGCPFHSKPAKSKTNSTECCKILRATSTLPGKTLTPSVADLPDVDPLFSDVAIRIAAEITVTIGTIDTGPPGKTSFLELNRSLHAHAPPVLA